MQQWVYFALLTSYKIFLTQVQRIVGACVRACVRARACVCVCILALVIRHSKHIISTLHNTFTCGLSGSTNIFSLYVI